MRDVMVDRLLLLKLLQLLRDSDATVGSTKLQKLVFLAEKAAISERVECFHYTYVRAKHGPYSVALERDRAMLVILGYVELAPLPTGPGSIVRLSNSGEEVLKMFNSFFERNKDQVRMLENVVREFGEVSLKELLDHVYNLESGLKGRKGVRISELPMRAKILVPYKPRFERRIDVTDEELVSLRVVMDPETEEFWIREVKGREVILCRYRGDKWITVVVPSLPGCVTQGLTEEEALRNAEEAIELYLEVAGR